MSGGGGGGKREVVVVLAVVVEKAVVVEMVLAEDPSKSVLRNESGGRVGGLHASLFWDREKGV